MIDETPLSEIRPNLLVAWRRVRASPDPKADDPPRTVAVLPGALLRRLEVHDDSRGSLHEAWRDTWAEEEVGGVAQAYISETRPGVVKGWHLHLRQTDRFLVVRGRATILLADLRAPSWRVGRVAAPFGSSWGNCRPSLAMLCAEGIAVAEVPLRADRPSTLSIPPGVAHGWIAEGPEDLAVLNLVTHTYDGTDEYRIPPGQPLGPGLPAVDWRERVDG